MLLTGEFSEQSRPHGGEGGESIGRGKPVSPKLEKVHFLWARHLKPSAKILNLTSRDPNGMD